jgi:dTDP-4-dehydrorhamnose reductase
MIILNMKILLYGSKGWIGSMFLNLIKNKNIYFFEGTSRVDNVEDVKAEIDLIKPTHVVSFIGRTHGITNGINFSTIDYLEQEGKLVENIRDNLFSPFVLAQICQTKNIHYTYLGTGCIFKYDDIHDEIGFNENDLPNFFGSSYSVVKGFTDIMMHMYPNVLNLRIRMPITNKKNSRNFITKITNYKKICSIKNSMTVLDELLPYVLDMMINNITGTINLTNPGVISHNEILEMYKEIVDPEFKWENFTQEEQRQILKADRSNNYMDTTKLELLYPEIMNIKDAVKKCLIIYKNNV